MPRLCALILLAGVAIAAVPRPRPVVRLARALTQGEMVLLRAASPSPSVH